MRKIRTILGALAIMMIFCAFQQDKKVTVFMIGDSTMANKDTTGGKQERGWGMVLQPFFNDPYVIDNHAVNGRSSKSFINEGRWQKVLDKIQPGDYVIIQFGHNDEKPAVDRHTDPGSTFDDNLRRFVRETREKGGNPILCNCVVRRNFHRQVDSTVEDESLRDVKYSDEEVNSDTLIDTHGAYREVPRYIAKEMNVPFIDSNKITHDLEQGLGVVKSRKLHMWFKPGETPSIPGGRKDNTHYNIPGASMVAALLADEMRNTIPALRPHINKKMIKKTKKNFAKYIKKSE